MKRLTYLRNMPATLLCMINMIFSLLAFVVLFRTVFFFGTFVGTIIRAFQFQDFTMIQKNITDALVSSGTMQYIDQITGGITISFTFGLIHTILISILLILSALLYPILIILNGVASLNLRTRGKSSHMLQVIHSIHAVLNILTMISVIAVAVFLFISEQIRTVLKSGASGNLVFLILGSLIAIAIILIVQFVIFCYHKDVAQNMSFIDSDAIGAEDYLDENHLSGLAFFFGLILLCPVVGLLYLLKYGYNPGSIILTIFFLLLAFKFFLVAACNRILKKTVHSRNRRNRR